MNKKHGADVVLLDAWRSARALGYRWDHLFKGHLTAGEISNRLHVGNGNPVGLPLRNCSGCDSEVGRESSGAPLLCSKPSVQVHATSLVVAKPSRQAVSKPAMVSICLTMDAERRQRFKDWFAGHPCRGSRAKLIAMTGLSKGRVAQLFDDKQPFGEKAAHSLAKLLKLPDEHYFERAQTPSPARMPNGQIDFTARTVSDSQWAVLDDLDALPDAEREKLVAQIREQAAVFKEYRQQLLDKIAAESKSKAPAAAGTQNVAVIEPKDKPIRRSTSTLGGAKQPSKKSGVR